MDGAKLVTDTVDFRKESGRQAFYLVRSTSVKSCQPNKNENPGGSRRIAV